MLNFIKYYIKDIKEQLELVYSRVVTVGQKDIKVILLRKKTLISLSRQGQMNTHKDNKDLWTIPEDPNVFQSVSRKEHLVLEIHDVYFIQIVFKKLLLVTACTIIKVLLNHNPRGISGTIYQ